MFNKILVPLALALGFAAEAQDLDLAFQHGHGGTVILQSSYCHVGGEQLYTAILTMPAGESVPGCYYLDSETGIIHMNWRPGIRVEYNIKDFKLFNLDHYL